MSKLDNDITARAKAATWEEVKQEVNAVSHVSRDIDEIKRKYKDLRVSVKKKASKMQDTWKVQVGKNINFSIVYVLSWAVLD